jgi:hypothetical protein
MTDALSAGAEMGPKYGEKIGNSQSIDPRGPVVIELTQVRKADSHR